jgi:hypothetical protein
MDLYDEKRTLVHAGALARRSSDWSGWADHFVALLDNYRAYLPATAARPSPRPQ